VAIKKAFGTLPGPAGEHLAGRLAAALREQEPVDAPAFGVQAASASCASFGTRERILALPAGA